MKPDEAQDIFYAEYAKGYEAHTHLNNPVRQREIRARAWQAVIDAIKGDACHHEPAPAKAGDSR